MNKKTLIFDCFGVLYPEASGDFYKRHKDLFNGEEEFINKLNLQIDLGQIKKSEFFTVLEKKTGIPSVQIQSEIDEELMAPNAQLVAFIQKLKEKYKIGLLSNAGQEEIAIIYRDKIDYLFDSITVSYEAGAVKPSPEIFQICLKRLNAEPAECIFIDDKVSNITAAENMGITSILYKDVEKLKTELLKYNIS